MKSRLACLCLSLAACISAVAQQGSTLAPIATQVVVPRLIRFTGQVNATGRVGVTFTLHKSPQDNSPLWIETQNVSADATGKFTALLGSTKSEGIPMDLFASGEAQWLAIHVEGQPEQPRVLLVSVPYALKAAEADTLAGHAASEFVTAGNLSTAVQREIQQAHFNTSATKANHINGVLTDPATDFSDTTSGQVVAITQLGTGKALYATSPSSMAIEGVATAATGSSFGVYGQSASSSGVGIFGSATSATGSSIALFGSAASTSGIAIAANESATSGKTIGLEATVSSADGTAALIQNKAGGPVISARSGPTSQRVFDLDGIGNATVYGSLSAYGYKATSGNSAIWGGGSSGKDGVDGISDTGNGVYGVNASGRFASTAGVLGMDVNPSASFSTYAVEGGVWGDTGSASSNNIGIYAGLVGSADNSPAGYLFNNSKGYPTLSLYNAGGGGTGAASPSLFSTFVASTPNGSCGIGSQGDLTCTGQMKTLTTTDDARKIETYAMQSPENWMEDFGSGTLQQGVAVVNLDPIFAKTVSTTADYHVFLTPNGDSKGLYVVRKTATSFEVRESAGGTSSLNFDYRIVAKRRGFETQRLDDVTERFAVEEKAMRPPANSRPRPQQSTTLPIESHTGAPR